MKTLKLLKINRCEVFKTVEIPAPFGPGDVMDFENESWTILKIVGDLCYVREFQGRPNRIIAYPKQSHASDNTRA